MTKITMAILAERVETLAKIAEIPLVVDTLPAYGSAIMTAEYLPLSSRMSTREAYYWANGAITGFGMAPHGGAPLDAPAALASLGQQQHDDEEEGTPDLYKEARAIAEEAMQSIKEHPEPIDEVIANIAEWHELAIYPAKALAFCAANDVSAGEGYLAGMGQTPRGPIGEWARLVASAALEVEALQIAAEIMAADDDSE